MARLIIATLLIISIMHHATAAENSSVETCSRIAIINFQEVLIDTTPSKKAEGLRFYLSKDPEALEYLNKYQNNTNYEWPSALVGTVGTGMVITSLFIRNDKKRRDSFLIGGAAIWVVNFLVLQTLRGNNESYLDRAIEEYNKRNLPRIYFSRDKRPEGANLTTEKIIGIELSTNF